MKNIDIRIVTNALKRICKRNGYDIITDRNALESIVGDLLPGDNFEVERQSLITAIHAGIVEQLFKASAKTVPEQKNAIISSRKNLIDNYGQQEKRAIAVVEAIACAFEFDPSALPPKKISAILYNIGFCIKNLIFMIKNRPFYRNAAISAVGISLCCGVYYGFYFPRGYVMLNIKNAKKATVSLSTQEKIIQRGNTTDGSIIMRAPLDKDLRLSVISKGFVDYTSNLHLDKKNPTANIDINMDRPLADFKVKMTNDKLPARAKVSITNNNGKLIANGEKFIADNLSASFKVPVDQKLKIKVTAPGFISNEQYVLLQHNESSKELPVFLRRDKGTVAVNLSGDGVVDCSPIVCLMQNGKKISSQSVINGKAVKFEVDLDKNYVLKVVSKLHIPIQHAVRVNSSDYNFNNKLSFNLVKLPSLRIFTVPNAKVFLNNKFIGKADNSGNILLSDNISYDKSYQVTCKLDGFGSKSKDVYIKPGISNYFSIVLERLPKIAKSSDNYREIHDVSIEHSESLADMTRVMELEDDFDYEEEYIYKLGQRAGLLGDFDEQIALYTEAADMGSIGAKLELAIDYFTGKNVKQDYVKAIELFTEASELGSDTAQYFLGTIYLEGNVVDQDYDKAVYYLRKAVEKNHAGAQVTLGNMYESGQGVKQNYAQAVKLYKLAAMQENNAMIDADYALSSYVSSAQFLLGTMYETGHGVEQSYYEAEKWYKKASERGVAEAQVNLGKFYFAGLGVEKDNKKAFEYFNKASEQGNALGQCWLGTIYKFGLGVEKNYKKAFEWYCKAAEQGDNLACNYIGEMYVVGLGVAQDYKKAFEWYSRAAENGDAQAQACIGKLYEVGKGVKQDYSKAFEWYVKSAEQGNDVAQFNLGGLYLTGMGTEQNYDKALQLFKVAVSKGNIQAQQALAVLKKAEAEQILKSAEQGNAEAQYLLGCLYESGEGIEQNYSKALEWYRKAAEQGNAGAQSCLGKFYEEGLGVQQDYNESAKWYRKAAECGEPAAQLAMVQICLVEKKYPEAVQWCYKVAKQGNVKAQCFMGQFYELGIGVTKDYKEAFYWYTKAAEHKDGKALFKLGTFYEEGLSVNKDLDKAKELYRKSAEQGNNDAINKLKSHK